MFKSRLPLQTPITIKLLLFASLATLFAGWLLSSEASSQEYSSEAKTVARSKSERELARLAHQQINEYRVSKNLAPLKLNPLISEQAKIHSQDMAQGIVEFGHAGFEDRVEAIKETISYRSAAENVAYNMGHQNPVDRAVAGWIDSDGHRKNIEGNYNLTGMGVAVNPEGEYYFTQIFILEN